MQYDSVYRSKPMSQIIAPSAGGTSAAPTAEQLAAAEVERQQALPEKYQGKSAKEIAEMHMNSEKRLGQIQNEVGQLRGLVSDLAQVQRSPNPVTPAPVSVDVSGDELIANPGDAIRKVVTPLVEAATQPTPQADPTANVEYTMEQNALVSDFGDPQVIANSEEFQQFVQRTGGRQADFQRACDATLGIEQVRAARRLLEDFTDFKASLPTSEAQTIANSVEAAKKVATEGAGPSGPVAVADPIYEADVIAMINRDPAKYRSPSFQAQLHAAIREGRYIKNG